MSALDGLYLYEIVLLVLGIVLFLVLTVAFLILITKRRSYSKLLAFFAIPIVMIGFPSIKSFEVSASVLKIEKETSALEEDPTDESVRASLEQEVASVSSRPITASQASVTIARAQIALGNDAAAKERVENTLKEDPHLPAAIDLKKRIELHEEVDSLTSQVEQDPGDTAARARLTSAVREAARLPIASPERMTNLARAQRVLGDSAKARENVERALRIDPNLRPAIQLQGQITTAVPHTH